MLSYVPKRVSRGWKSFIALFLGVTIATTLFSGTMMGAENVGRGMLNEATSLVDVDIVVADLLRNLSTLDLSVLEADILAMDRVAYTEQLIRWEAPLNYLDPSDLNKSVDFTIVVVEENSTLWKDVFGTGFEGFGMNEIYVESDSVHAPEIDVGSNITLYVYTFDPIATPGFKTFRFNLTLAGLLDLDIRSYMMSSGEYPYFLSWILLGTGREIRKPSHDLLFISRETLLSIFEEVYDEGRLPNKQITAEVLVDLDRDEVLNPWDLANSIRRVKLISEQIDNEVQIHQLHSWQNFLEDVLETVKSITDSLKIRFVLVALPVFFTAWYMGVTVSDVLLTSRRREVGLLLTKGFTRRQIFQMFLVEAFLIGLLSGLAGIVTSTFIVPLFGVGSASTMWASSSTTLALFTLLFSVTVSLLSVLMPAWTVSNMNMIDTLKEYWEVEEEKLQNMREPIMALTLGLYKLLMFFFGVSVESFRPAGGGLLVFVLYSTWWGVDYILGYLGPILFFWGFTKLFIQGSFHVQEAIMSATGRLIGDISRLATLNARRTMRRTAAIAFLVALIFGYSVSVIGGIASSDDRLVRIARSNVGADASVWLFSDEGARKLAEEIGALKGVASTALERWFYVETAFLTIQLRAIDPEAWAETAYFEEDWLTVGSRTAFQSLAESNETIILFRGLSDAAGLVVGDKITFNIAYQVYATLTIADHLGPGLSEGGQIQSLPSYVPDGFLERYPQLEVVKTRILVQLEPDADAAELARIVEGMDLNVEAVDTAAEQLEMVSNNIFLKGPKQVQELGVPFATLVSSVGVALVVSTTLGERNKEITLMAIRGYSFRQLFTMLLVENVSNVALPILIGAIVGYVNIMGDVALSNTAGQLILSHVVFTQTSILFIVAIMVAILISVVAPIVAAAMRTSSRLSWRIIG